MIPAHGFTQSGVGIDFIGNGIPMGHEWLTRLAALEILGGDPIVAPDPNDPRKLWPAQGLAKATSLVGAQSEVHRIKSTPIGNDTRYESVYRPIFDAIIGQRWVDLGGFNVTKAMASTYNCYAAVAQEPADLQNDHTMRRFDEREGSGGVSAAASAQQRFIDYFVTAATAPAGIITVWDGGGYSAQVDVDRNYFLFGRAIHLLQDSFSSEHAVRIGDDWYNRLRQVKSYNCAAGSEQHTHSNTEIFAYTSGDVIWQPGTQFTTGWSSYKTSFMKPTALAATEATKDLWAAFIRVMALPLAQRDAAARAEAATLVTNWLSYDPAEMSNWYADPSRRDSTYVLGTGDSLPGQTVAACMQSIGHNTPDPDVRNAQIESVRRICVYNIKPVTGYADLSDPELRIPFNWGWQSSISWLTPPAGWVVPNVPADTGTPVRIRSVANGQFMTAPAGLTNDATIYCQPGTPVDFTRVGSGSNVYFRARYAPSLFFSYKFTSGDAKLWKGTSDSNYRLDPQTQGYAIYNPRWSDYFWLKGLIPRLDSDGNPSNANARWSIEAQQ
ncbi:MAG TPA: hemolysin D [Thermoanaerobaculia bacterium]|nr:hemolysin D [Thermoanaerobaculia bacterium]